MGKKKGKKSKSQDSNDNRSNNEPRNNNEGDQENMVQQQSSRYPEYPQINLDNNYISNLVSFCDQIRNTNQDRAEIAQFRMIHPNFGREEKTVTLIFNPSCGNGISGSLYILGFENEEGIHFFEDAKKISGENLRNQTSSLRFNSNYENGLKFDFTKEKISKTNLSKSFDALNNWNPENTDNRTTQKIVEELKTSLARLIITSAEAARSPDIAIAIESVLLQEVDRGYSLHNIQDKIKEWGHSGFNLIDGDQIKAMRAKSPNNRIDDDNKSDIDDNKSNNEDNPRTAIESPNANNLSDNSRNRGRA